MSFGAVMYPLKFCESVICTIQIASGSHVGSNHPLIVWHSEVVSSDDCSN